MNKRNWILLDTETTGFASPIYVVEIGAQRMSGWEPCGAPFRKILNQNQDIPAEASRVHGYTREILERDGEPPVAAYGALREYVGDLPLVSFNTDYDLAQVLQPEWLRLGIAPMGGEGFCALRLAQRLLDPVPAGNCKLQTLRQYYRLPERGAHTALGDVLTVADLFSGVLRPIAEARGLQTWDAIQKFATEEWYPSRIAFGKYKGTPIQAARESRAFREWLESLARSSNARSGRMGRWYLRQLEAAEPELPFAAFPIEPDQNEGAATVFAVVIYEHPELKRLRALVDAARGRLAEMESSYVVEKAKVDALQATLFARLREYYQRRDRLQLIVDYRQQFVDTLLRQGEEAAAQVERDYREAKDKSDQEYEKTSASLATKKQLTSEEEAEVRQIWKKLVNLYHPDRFSSEPDKLETYGKLTAAINEAKDNGDLETLRQIANDPQEFILRQGWTNLDFRDEDQIAKLRKLWESLEIEILNIIEATNQLSESPEFELCRLVEKEPELLDRVVEKQASLLKKEISGLQCTADELGREVEELTGEGMAGEE